MAEPRIPNPAVGGSSPSCPALFPVKSMSFRLYKEGQGNWTRGTLATLIGLTGVFAAISLFDWLGTQEWATEGQGVFPFFNWKISWQVLLSGLLMVPFGLVGIWLFNQRKLSDFLIDTESELKNKVTWPTRREVANNSIVVVVTCVLMGVWIMFADQLFRVLKDWVYGLGH